MFRQKMTFWSFTRLFVAIMGYIGFKLFDAKGPYAKKLLKTK
jgi:hypothetical protein